MNDTSAKQLIVEKIKDSSNILVTVSSNPSVDDLSAALGLTLLLNKMNKHATAVFSGAIPPAITFLDPEKTFENTVDSLRDFIIALDKEKADHLRYKVEGEVVKIFITPYRTTISSDDLDFSQGDYNVELVLALGVKNQDSLDAALTAHGRILHDATVATIMADGQLSELGSIDWHDDNASSLSEMLVSLSEALKVDKTLLDEQIATALLTGIVSATERFSNPKTSSRVMTMAAQLMAAGANQQLIAAELQQDQPTVSGDGASEAQSSEVTSENSDGTTNLSEGESTKLSKKEASKKKEEKKKNDGELDISHELKGDVDSVAEQVVENNQDQAAHVAEEKLAAQLATPPTAAMLSVADLQKDLAEASADVDAAASNQETPTQPESPASVEPEQSSPAPVTEPEALHGAVDPDTWKKTDEPTLGGTLNATAEQAADDKRREEEKDRNHTLLSHGGEYIGDAQPIYQAPINGAVVGDQEPPSVDPFGDVAPADDPNASKPTAYVPPIQPLSQQPETVSEAPSSLPELAFEMSPVPTPAPGPTLAQIDEANRNPLSHDEARAEVHAALDGIPAESAQFDPFAQVPDSSSAAPTPADATLPPPPPLPDFSTLPPMPSATPAPAPAPFEPGVLSGPVPSDKLGDIFGPTPSEPSTQSTPAAPPDPGQFRIPGQN